MSTTARHHQPATARQMPLPLREPPFDDERGDGHGRPVQSVATSTPVTQGSLALAHVLPFGTPAVPEPATALHLVDLGVVDLGAGGVAAPMPTQGRRASTRPAEPADARRWSARLAQGIAEALAGHLHVARDGAEALSFIFCEGSHAYRHIDDWPKVVLLDLKLPAHHHRSHQLEPQALEGRIVGWKLTLGPDGTPLKVPDIHTQHSPLT